MENYIDSGRATPTTIQLESRLWVLSLREITHPSILNLFSHQRLAFLPLRVLNSKKHCNFGISNYRSKYYQTIIKTIIKLLY